MLEKPIGEDVEARSDEGSGSAFDPEGTVAPSTSCRAGGDGRRSSRGGTGGLALPSPTGRTRLGLELRRDGGAASDEGPGYTASKFMTGILGGDPGRRQLRLVYWCSTDGKLKTKAQQVAASHAAPHGAALLRDRGWGPTPRSCRPTTASYTPTPRYVGTTLQRFWSQEGHLDPPRRRWAFGSSQPFR